MILTMNLCKTAFILNPGPCLLPFSTSFTQHYQSHRRHLSCTPANHMRQARTPPPTIKTRIENCVPNTSKRGPSTPAPDYTALDANPLNALFTSIFLSKLTNELGYTPSFDSHTDTYSRVIHIIKRLAEKYRGRPSQLNKASQRVIASLFPKWLPSLFVNMFARPSPYVAAWLNAIVTVGVTQWLMGPSSIIKEQEEDQAVFTVQIDRCRYLEETGCVGICLHSCKAATQDFFTDNMGIPLNIDPNLDDYSCKFQFGKTPLPMHLDPMYSQPCFTSCPSAIPINPKSIQLQQQSDSPPCHAIEGSEKQNDVDRIERESR